MDNDSGNMLETIICSALIAVCIYIFFVIGLS